MAAAFWDTNLFIYLVEGRPAPLAALARKAREAMLARGDRLVTSALTVGELLVRPTAEGRKDLADRYLSLIGEGATVVPFDEDAARRYAEVRAGFPKVSPPDAVQLACAAQHGAAIFVANDRRLAKVQVRGVGRVAVLEELQ